VTRRPRVAYLSQETLDFCDGPIPPAFVYGDEDVAEFEGTRELCLPTFDAHVQLSVGSPQFVRYVHGPAGVSLAEAVEWARPRSTDITVYLGGHGPVDLGALDTAPIRTGKSVDLGPSRTWRVRTVGELSEADDYERAAAVFEPALRSDPAVDVLRVALRSRLRRIEATVAIDAPIRRLAASRAMSAALRAATSGPDGLWITDGWSVTSVTLWETP
jgi:hypothetical protein